MNYIYQWLIPAAWVSLLLYWYISASSAKKIKVNEPVGVRLFYQSIVWAALAIVALHDKIPLLDYPLWHRTELGFFVGAAITLAGLGFAVWARAHLGQYWSATVALKEDHQLIFSGPYKVVRHPIYTGLITGMAGTAIALAEVNGLLAFIIYFLVFWWKGRREETLMIQTFGDQYVQYCKEVPALVPFLKL
jgi:protein-S-isoprenylcysteine O-methyltransferase Ste14